jgi:3-dehydroquinate dehydratase-1
MLTTPRQSAIVAVIAALPDFDQLLALSANHIDLCELRIDRLYGSSANLATLSSKISIPKIATVRDSSEGGANGLPEATRLELFQRWLPHCNLVDIELSNLSRFSALIEQAESEGKEIIFSFHDFEKTPSLEVLQGMLDHCRLRQNQIFKVATNVEHWSDVETLVHLIERNPEIRVAAMGMGKFGKLSRLVLARLGSCLTYGSIGESVVPGQWPVSELARLLSEL